MGYSNYIYSLPKSLYDKIKDLSEDELINKFGDVDYFNPFTHLDIKELYDFGKYTEFEIENTLSNVFSDAELNEDGDTEFKLAKKETLEIIINSYKEKIKNYYKNLLECNDKDSFQEHIKDISFEWTHLEAVNLDLKKEKITNSWKYEYTIFELVRIYKTFDFEKNILIYGGH